MGFVVKHQRRLTDAEKNALADDIVRKMNQYMSAINSRTSSISRTSPSGITSIVSAFLRENMVRVGSGTKAISLIKLSSGFANVYFNSGSIYKSSDWENSGNGSSRTIYNFPQGTGMASGTNEKIDLKGWRYLYVEAIFNKSLNSQTGETCCYIDLYSSKPTSYSAAMNNKVAIYGRTDYDRRVNGHPSHTYKPMPLCRIVEKIDVSSLNDSYYVAFVIGNPSYQYTFQQNGQILRMWLEK